MADSIRPARPADARDIAEVHVAGWQCGYRGLIDQAYLDVLSVDEREQGWSRALLGGEEAVLVHERNGRVDAFTCYGACRDSDVPDAAGEVYALYVHPGAWRAGIGGRLLAAAVEDLRVRAGGATGGDPSAPAVASEVLWVLEGNERARRFYERQGWRPDGRRREDHRPAVGAVPGISFIEVRYRHDIPAQPPAPIPDR